MRLLIFVGAGSPELSQYRDVYELLQLAAPRYGYTDVDWSLRWEGQGLQPQLCSEPLQLSTAVDKGVRKIVEFERLGTEYDIVGRSFGALVAAACVVPRWPKNLRKLILWGPPVYWKMYDKFVRDFEESRKYNLTKGVRIESNYFSSLVPLESLVNELSGPVRLATGSRDTYCSPEFLTYVLSLRENASEQLTVRVANDASYEVTPQSPPYVVSSYLDALFGN